MSVLYEFLIKDATHVEYNPPKQSLTHLDLNGENKKEEEVEEEDPDLLLDQFDFIDDISPRETNSM